MPFLEKPPPEPTLSLLWHQSGLVRFSGSKQLLHSSWRLRRLCGDYSTPGQFARTEWWLPQQPSTYWGPRPRVMGLMGSCLRPQGREWTPGKYGRIPRQEIQLQHPTSNINAKNCTIYTSIYRCRMSFKTLIFFLCNLYEKFVFSLRRGFCKYSYKWPNCDINEL